MINRIYIPGTLHRKIDGTVELQGDRDLMQSYFSELLGIDNYCDVEICFVRSEDKKSNPQLKYFFGIVLPIIKQAFEEMQGESYSKEEIVSNAIKKGLMTNLLNNLQGYPLKELWKLEKN
jgi:hypothetical protein